MSLWRIRDLEFELDLEDADDAERYEKAFLQLDEDEKAIKKDGTLSEMIKSSCGIYYKLFDSIFGEGAGLNILGEKFNLRVCEETFDSFIQFCGKQVKDTNERRSKMVAKYKPRSKRIS
jgi:hypothetical protein